MTSEYTSKFALRPIGLGRLVLALGDAESVLDPDEAMVLRDMLTAWIGDEKVAWRSECVDPKIWDTYAQTSKTVSE